MCLEQREEVSGETLVELLATKQKNELEQSIREFVFGRVESFYANQSSVLDDGTTDSNSFTATGCGNSVLLVLARPLPGTNDSIKTNDWLCLVEHAIKSVVSQHQHISQWLMVNQREEEESMLDSYATSLFEMLCHIVLEREKARLLESSVLKHREPSSSPYHTIAQLLHFAGNDHLWSELGIDHQSIELLTRAIVECSRQRYTYPMKDATKSSALHMALYLRSNNARFSQERAARCQSQLNQFEQEAQIIAFFSDYNKQRTCTVREQIGNVTERELYARHAQTFDDIKHRTHTVPGSQPF